MMTASMRRACARPTAPPAATTWVVAPATVLTSVKTPGVSFIAPRAVHAIELRAPWAISP